MEQALLLGDPEVGTQRSVCHGKGRKAGGPKTLSQILDTVAQFQAFCKL